MRVRVQNGEITAYQLPIHGDLSTGERVSHYHRLPAAVFESEGWVEVEDDGPPPHDPTTEFAQQSLEVNESGGVVAVYTIHSLPPDPSQGDHLDPQVGAPDA